MADDIPSPAPPPVDLGSAPTMPMATDLPNTAPSEALTLPVETAALEVPAPIAPPVEGFTVIPATSDPLPMPSQLPMPELPPPPMPILTRPSPPRPPMPPLPQLQRPQSPPTRTPASNLATPSPRTATKAAAALPPPLSSTAVAQGIESMAEIVTAVRRRHFWLALVGAGLVALGILAAFPMPLAAAARGHALWGDHERLIRLGLMSLLPCLLLLTLGLGLIHGRRWARDILVALSALAFVAVMLGIVVNLVQMWPAIAERSLRPQRILSGMAASLGALIIPWLAVAFFSGKHSRLACDIIDTKTRWTSLLPGGSLILVLLCLVASWGCGLASLSQPFPFFGQLLEAPVAMKAWLGLSGGFLLLALMNGCRWSLGWWGALVLFTALFATLAWSALLGSPASLASWWHCPALTSAQGGWLLLLGGLALVGFLTTLPAKKSTTSA